MLYWWGIIFIRPLKDNRRECQHTRRVQIFTSGLSFVSLNLTPAEQRGDIIISAPTSHMRHNAAILQSTLLALGLRDNLAALIRELKAGMAALQEISTKVSFFSTQNPLLPNRYLQIPTCSVITEERQSLLA